MQWLHSRMSRRHGDVDGVGGQLKVLERMNHITYGALKQHQPACNSGKSGKAYSKSCLPKESNPESRGCSEYYRCRQGIRSPVTLFT
ncbi:hypothetical protein CsSME_00010756 [Camellia sinensis var. sinensis]